MSDGNGQDVQQQRGRKSGTVNSSLAARAARQRETLAKQRAELRELERKAADRKALIIGRVVLDAVEANKAAMQWLGRLLRAAKISATDKAEVADLFIASAETEPAPPSPRAAIESARPLVAVGVVTK